MLFRSFVVFAVWAVFGFAFPAEPLPLALNVISKILCFVAAIMLFAWPADLPMPANGCVPRSGLGGQEALPPGS